MDKLKIERVPERPKVGELVTYGGPKIPERVSHGPGIRVPYRVDQTAQSHRHCDDNPVQKLGFPENKPEITVFLFHGLWISFVNLGRNVSRHKCRRRTVVLRRLVIDRKGFRVVRHHRIKDRVGVSGPSVNHDAVDF